MPRVTLIPGDRLYVDFCIHRDGTMIPERLAIDLTENKATIKILLEQEGRIVEADTIFEVNVVREPAPDPVMQDFGDMLTQVFGEGSVFVADEHGIRPLKPGKQN